MAVCKTVGPEWRGSGFRNHAGVFPASFLTSRSLRVASRSRQQVITTPIAKPCLTSSQAPLTVWRRLRRPAAGRRVPSSRETSPRFCASRRTHAGARRTLWWCLRTSRCARSYDGCRSFPADQGKRPFPEATAKAREWNHAIMQGMGELILIRHGETEWSRSGQHAGRTDVPLTDAGMAVGKALAPALACHHMVAAFSSPMGRAMRTAELVGLTGIKSDPGLMEWDYGGYEGMTEAQIREMRPGWNLWRDGVIPGNAARPGETLQQVAARTDAVLNRIRPLLNDGDVALVAHGHLQRVLTARWLGLDPSAGAVAPPTPGQPQRSGHRARAAGHLRLERLIARRFRGCFPRSAVVSASAATRPPASHNDTLRQGLA